MAEKMLYRKNRKSVETTTKEDDDRERSFLRSLASEFAFVLGSEWARESSGDRHFAQASSEQFG